MTKLTDITVRNFKPQPKRFEVPDSGCAGLYCIVQPVTGAKTFAVRYRFGGRSRKLTLERGISLAAARKLTADAKLAVAQGRDPAAEKKTQKNRTTGAAADTLAVVVARYFRDPRVKTLRTASQSEATLRRNVLPTFGPRPIGSIKRSELVALSDELITTRGARSADATLKNLSAVFNWFALRDPTEAFRSPIIKGMSSYKPREHRRVRVLSDDEIRALWAAAGELGVYGSLLKFLLTTGARRAEACAMTTDELKDGIWTLPAARNKTGEVLERPLSRLALSILDELPRTEGSPYIFTLSGSRPLGGHSRHKKKLDARLQFAQQWQLHDLRRVARSLLSRAGIANDIAEMCLGHVLPGIRATYDRHKYIEQKRHAFEALATLVLRITEPPPEGSNVVAFPQAAS
jgi:integrase